jgi:hypothetical protein
VIYSLELSASSSSASACTCAVLQPRLDRCQDGLLSQIPADRSGASARQRVIGEYGNHVPLQSLKEYQTPEKVDKIMKLDKQARHCTMLLHALFTVVCVAAQLGETKEILYKTIDAVLARGEKLDELVRCDPCSQLEGCGPPLLLHTQQRRYSLLSSLFVALCAAFTSRHDAWCRLTNQHSCRPAPSSFTSRPRRPTLVAS